MKSSHMPSLSFLYRFGIFFQLAKLDNLPNDRSIEVHSGKQKKVVDLLRLCLSRTSSILGAIPAPVSNFLSTPAAQEKKNQDAFSQVNLGTPGDLPVPLFTQMP